MGNYELEIEREHEPPCPILDWHFGDRMLRPFWFLSFGNPCLQRVRFFFWPMLHVDVRRVSILRWPRKFFRRTHSVVRLGSLDAVAVCKTA